MGPGWALVAVFVLNAAFVSQGAKENCKFSKSSQCRCEIEGKVSIDISDYFDYPKNNIPDEQNPGKYTYSYSPCKPIACASGKPATARACQHKAGSFDFNIGSDATNWTVSSLDPLTFEISYHTTGEARNSRVTFTHTSGSVSIVMTTEDEDDSTYKFNVNGKAVAPASGGRGGGGGGGTAPGVIGLVLISLSIVGLITYFVAGGLFNYYHRGARGVEVIPNYTFWKDLPFLIKDGFLFTISPCWKGAADKISYQNL